MGRVHSVFKSSLNVMVGDCLINFSQKGMPLSAHGCLLEKETIGTLLNACRPQDIVRVKNGVFSFYTFKGVFKVDVSQMTEVDLSIPFFSKKESLSQTALYATLVTIPFFENIGLADSEFSQTAFEILKSWTSRTEKEQLDALAYLVGRGKGLTPSGDDILIGFTMIRKAFVDTNGLEKKLEKQVVAHNTTDISKAYYNALFFGYVSYLFFSLIHMIENTSEAEVKETVDRITHYGHTSGYDTLFGIYLGLCSLINQMEEEKEWKKDDIL